MVSPRKSRAMAGGHSTETPVLEHCLAVIHARKAAAITRAWFWGMRAKVATFSLTVARRNIPPDAPPAPPLTQEECADIEARHPLLEPWRPAPRPSAAATQEVRNALRARVDAFLLARGGGAGS